MIASLKHLPNLPQIDKMHTLQPGGEERAHADCTTTPIDQQGRQAWVVWKHPVDQRGPVSVLPQNKSGNQFL